MMKKEQKKLTLNWRLLTLAVLLCGAAAVSPAYGQYVTYSLIESGSGIIWSTSYTEIDPGAFYYGAAVSAELFDPNDNVLASGSDEEDYYAEVDLEVETGEGGWFGVYGYHWAWDIFEGDWDALGETSDYTDVSPSGGGPPPQIIGISPQSGIYGEGDGWGAGGGYVPIYGANFDPYDCQCLDWVSFGTVEFISDSQVNLYYDDGTAVGSYPIQLETSGGQYSNQVTFTIYGDPQPVISSISPSTWQAGQITSVTITGTGFGTAPSLNITGTGIDNCDGIQNCLVTNASDTGMTVAVTVNANAPNESVTVSVASNGYWGYGFLPQQGQSNQGNAQATVQALQVGIQVSGAQAPDDGDQANFSVAILSGNPTGYQWTSFFPTGAGNNPGVAFTAAGNGITVPNAHWFAYPDTPCAPLGATYPIQVAVTFPIGTITQSTTLTVVPKMPGGLTDFRQLLITGSPTIGVRDDGTGLWRVINQGNLARQIPTAQVYVLKASQFYDKAMQHEAVHVSQFQAGGLFGNFLLVADFYNAIQNLTDPTSAGLNAQMSAVWQAMTNNFQVNQYPPLHQQAEQEAYATSDPLAPQYVYQSQCVGQYGQN